jgi:hypothetical protein
MPFDTTDDLDHDFEILDVVGKHVDALVERLVRGGAPMKIVKRWLVGHAEPPDGPDSQITLFAAASDLELFTPSMSGKTPVDRYLASQRPETQDDRAAFAALGAAQFRLVRVVRRDGADLVRLMDLATQEELVLLDSLISPVAAGAPTAMRLCPLASGRHVLTSPLFLVDEATLAGAMTFVRPGRPLGHGHRCAAYLYREIARRGFIPMPTLAPAALDVTADLSEVQHLAMQCLLAEGVEDQTELIAEIRRAASLDNLVDACGWFANAVADRCERLVAAFSQIAEIQMETLCGRRSAGVRGYGEVLDGAAAAIARHIAAGAMEPGARELFERLRARWSLGDPAGHDGDSSTQRAELDRVIQRILGLRAKTVDRGCTESEAIAAAAKIAELLDRYDLSLDEVAVRRSDCAGATVETMRRRRAPVDSCVQPVAVFCDCRAWSEDTADGTLRYVFFGLKADVEAARYLYELIEVTFQTEAAAFRGSEIYSGLRGGGGRLALNSFQVGLANGIAAKLDGLKIARTANAATTTGFDLVTVKHSVVDDEVRKLGLHFTTTTASSRRLVHGDAYHAGKLAGAQFEPYRGINEARRSSPG